MLLARALYGFYVAKLPPVHLTSIDGMNPNCHLLDKGLEFESPG